MASKTSESVLEEESLVDRGSGAPDSIDFDCEDEPEPEYARALARAIAASLTANGLLEAKDTPNKQYRVFAAGAAIERWRLSASEEWAGTGQKTSSKAASANITFAEATDLDGVAIGGAVRVTYEQVGNTNSLRNVRVRRR
ncbi:MAG: hypothetical protein ABW217_22125 [Polyangiaceae bacterium]